MGERGSSVRSPETAAYGSRSADRTSDFGLRNPLAEILTEATALGRSRNWKYLEWRGGAAPENATPSTFLLAHDLDLRPDESALFGNLESSVRRALRKSEKAGLQVEFRTDPEAMGEYYRLHCLTRHKHGLPPQPFRFFRKIQEHVVGKGMGFVGLATLGGREKREEGREGRLVDSESHTPTLSPLHALRSSQSEGGSSLPSPHGATGAVAAAVFLHWNGRALYKFGASDERYLELRANNLLMWKAFLHCQSLGCTTVGMGRTDKGHDGLRRFKLGWGTVESEVPYYKLDLRRGGWGPEPNHHDMWLNRVFRVMPRPLARVAGELVYPHLD